MARTRKDPYAKAKQPAPAAMPSVDRDGQRIMALFERAQRLRAPFEGKMQECYDYALPTKAGMFSQSPGEDRTTKIFDETAVVGAQEFASRIQSGLMPPFSRWMKLEGGIDVPAEEKEEVDEALEGVTTYMFDVLQESNLADEVGEALLELAVGTGFVEINEGNVVEPIVAKALPSPQMWIDTGPDDRIDSYFRKHHLRLSHVRIKWPKAMIPAELIDAYTKAQEGIEDPTECFVEAIRRDYSQPNEERWDREVVHATTKTMLFRESFFGEGSCPIIGFRWSKMAGETWGRGPLQLVMPAIKTVNLTIELILENAEMSIAGLYTAEDDGVVNVDTISLVPGTIIPVAPGSAGLKAVAQAGNFDVSQLVLNDMRANIKRALFNDSLDTPGKTPRSATEVAERQADLSRAMGSNFSRLMFELVIPIVKRVVYLLKKQGRIEMPKTRTRSTSPLSRAQKMQDVSNFGQYTGMMGQLFGPQQVNLAVDASKAAVWLADQMDVPKHLARDKVEQDQLVAALQEQSAIPEPSGAPPTAGLPPGP